MGSTENIYEYNKLEDINHPRGEDFSGPYVFPKMKNFQKETVDHFQNKSIIENNIEKMKKFRDRPCLGRRLKIGENEKVNLYLKKSILILLIMKSFQCV